VLGGGNGLLVCCEVLSQELSTQQNIVSNILITPHIVHNTTAEATRGMEKFANAHVVAIVDGQNYSKEAPPAPFAFQLCMGRTMGRNNSELALVADTAEERCFLFIFCTNPYYPPFQFIAPPLRPLIN
jgi:hypothetical protein